MTAPSIVSQTNTNLDADNTTHPISLPTTGLVNDDILAIIGGWDGSISTVTPPSGWTAAAAVFQDGGGNNIHGFAYWRRRDGSEGATADFSSVNGQRCLARCWQLRGVPVSATPVVVTATSNGTSSNSCDLGAATLNSAKDYTAVAAAVHDIGDSAGTFTGFPAGYGNTGEQNQDAHSAAGIVMGYADKAGITGASSEDPGAFTFPSTARPWCAVLIVFEGESIGQPVQPSGITGAAVYGSHTIANVAARTFGPVGGLTTAAVYGSHTIGPAESVQTISPSGVASTAVYGTQTIAKVAARTIGPVGNISSSAVYGTSIVASDAGVSSAAVYGTHQVADSGVKVIGVPPAPSMQVYGTAAIGNSVELAAPAGLSSSALYGTHQLSISTPGLMQPSGTASSTVYGTHNVFLPFQGISIPGLLSGQRYGSHTLIGGVPNPDPPRGQLNTKTWASWRKLYV